MVSMKHTIFLKPRGGLGNQLFQYAFVKALACRLNRSLVIYSPSFCYDRRFGRQNLLSSFPCDLNKSDFTSYTLLVFSSFTSLLRRLLRLDSPSFYLREDDPGQYSSLDESRLSGSFIVKGYWQSPLYFSGYEDIIARDLSLPTPVSLDTLSMGEQLLACNSVAVGIRFYEETFDKGSSNTRGRVRDAADFAKVMHILSSEQSSPTFFLFSSVHSSTLRLLNLPGKVILITPDLGFHSPTDVLWLLSLSTHSIFNNSSLYWWGAWLREARQRQQGHSIGSTFATDNFVNNDTIPSHWRTF